MLPHISSEENIPPMGRKVYINPNFHSQIANSLQQSQGRPSNESTLQSSWDRPSIHINPYFLQRQREYQMHLQLQQQQQQQQLVTYYQQQQTVAAATDLMPPAAKIISKASTCLVRKQPVKNAIVTAPKPTVCPQAPLVSISKRKLVRQGANIAKVSPATSTVSIVPPPAKRTRYKLVRAISLTSTSSTPLVKTRRTRDFVARYALRRTNDTIVGKKLSLKSHILKPSVNKSLSMVSIHGVMYKKTAKNKLTKLDTSKLSKSTIKQTPQPSATLSTGRTLFVRGTKFVLDPSGCRLTRVPLNNINKSLLSRIDIGGLTYVSSPNTKNVFIRTSNHVARAHLQTAKQRSLQLLNRSLVKTNVPCAIFQRLGKCAAHSRGKCRRLHDKRQVAICPSFLRGECTKSVCLLSHNVTLEKMPVCRYFLRGACVREDCPYLHKKLSLKAEICIDFLRGYCARAADCNMRHEFICPEFARKGKCGLTNCSYCKQMKQQQKQKFMDVKSKSKFKLKVPAPNVKTTKEIITKIDEAPNSSRYFKCESEKVTPAVQPQDEDPHDEKSDEVSDEESSSAGNSNGPRQRPKLGTLPAFIPLGGSEEC